VNIAIAEPVPTFVTRSQPTRRVCSGCHLPKPTGDYTNPRANLCRPCRADYQRRAYARRQGGLKREHTYTIPTDFVAKAGKVSDRLLADLYAVSDKTIRRWRTHLNIPAKRTTHAERSTWGAMGMAKLRATMPERTSGTERSRRGAAVREARRLNLDAVLDSSGQVIPTSTASVLAEAGITRDLMQMAMQAMALAGSRVTQEDYA